MNIQRLRGLAGIDLAVDGNGSGTELQIARLDLDYVLLSVGAKLVLSLDGISELIAANACVFQPKAALARNDGVLCLHIRVAGGDSVGVRRNSALHEAAETGEIHP